MTKYMQTDSRWGGLGYPKSPYFIRNCGCGEVSIANILVEFDTKYTPANIQPYCKQYADPHGNGTYHSGIPAMMKHYGLTEVKEHATMKPLWDELAKGNRVAVYLMGSRKAGSKGVKWTSSGHFVCSTAYKYENGKHWVYVKDSYSNSSLRNGFISYEDNMKYAVLKVWSGKLPAKADGKLKVDGKGGLKTVNRLQAFLGVAQTDGITIRKDLQKYVPSLTAYDYGNGSPTVKAMQKWLGLSNPDGLWGANTSKALQKKVGVTADGIFGTNSMKALQTYLNTHDKAVYPTLTNADKIVAQAKALAWAEDTAPSKYAWKGGSATSAFKTALNKAYPNRKSWSKAPKAGCCCDVFVGTVINTAGIGVSNFPRGFDQQKKYTNSHFERLTYKNVTPYSVSKDGDIVMYYKKADGSSKHVLLRGNGYIYEAQYEKTYGHTNTSLSKIKKKMPYVVILRAK